MELTSREKALIISALMDAKKDIKKILDGPTASVTNHELTMLLNEHEALIEKITKG